MCKNYLSKRQPLIHMFSTLCLAILFLGLQGCISPSTHQNVVDQRDQCVSENATLKTQIIQRNVAINTLRQERDSVGAAAANLQGQNQRLAQILVEERQQAAQAEQAYSNLIDHMKESIVTNKINVQLMKSGVTVSLPNEVLFDSGSASLSAEGNQILAAIAAELKDLPYQTLVAGFTDNSQIGATLQERYPTNWELAGARAACVVRLLETNGVNSERLVALSFGEHRAVADNDSTAGRQKNRRIEIRLRPVDFSD